MHLHLLRLSGAAPHNDLGSWIVSNHLAFTAAHWHLHVWNRCSRPVHRYPCPRDRQVQRNNRCRDVSHRPADDPVYKPLGCERLPADRERSCRVNQHSSIGCTPCQSSIRRCKTERYVITYHLVFGIPCRNVRIYRPCGSSYQNNLHEHAALDKETFEMMWQDSEPDGKGAVAGLFFRHTHTEFRADGIDPSSWLDYMPNVSSPLCYGTTFHYAHLVVQQTTSHSTVRYQNMNSSQVPQLGIHSPPLLLIHPHT